MVCVRFFVCLAVCLFVLGSFAWELSSGIFHLGTLGCRRRRPFLRTGAPSMRPSPPARHFPHEPIVETRTFPPLREQFALLQNDSAQAAKKNCRWRLVQDPRDASLSPRTGRDGRQQVANSRQPPKIHLWDPGHQKHLQPFAFPPRWGDVNQGVSVSLAQSFLLLQRQFPV